MADMASIIGAVAALAGVFLGAWLSSRSQLRLHRETQRRAEMLGREAAYVEFLATMRRFRRFVLTAPVKVDVVHGAGSPRGPIPIIEGSDRHWDAAEGAISRLRIVSALDGPVSKAASQVIDALYEVARERAKKEPGAVPASIIDVSRAAERDFVWAAQRDLGRPVDVHDEGLRLRANRTP